MSSTSDPTAVFTPAARVRGTLAIIAGRDETTAVYRRFGTRISADGYTVGVFDGPDAAAAWLGEQPEGPRVLVGSDTGASAVLRALTQGDIADAAIVAGLVIDPEHSPTDAERTACPVHLGVLAEQHATTVATSQAEGGEPVEEIPDQADLAAISVPVLAVHGGADPVSPFAQIQTVLSAIPDVETVETVDGLHDALNDQSHRSVAASIVLWLERLRTGDVHAPVVRHAEDVNA